MRPTPRLRQALFDSALCLGVAVSGCVAGTEYQPAGWNAFDARAYLLTCLVALPLAVRRSLPVTTLVGCCLAYSLFLAVGYQPSVNWWAVVISLVGVAARRSSRVTAAGAALAAAVVLQSGFAGHLGLPLTVGQALLVPSVCMLFGRGQRELALRNGELRRLTEALAHEQREQARRAVIDERLRIARELHDVVAHHMSVISVQAGLAEYVFASDALTARSALSTIAGASREALHDLRRLLTVLRVDSEAHDDSAAPLGPLPELSRVGELAQRIEAVGVTIEIQTTGVARRLDPGLEVCAYRVLQEALTNVVKHAESARVEVHIAYGEDQLNILVRDNGGTGKPAIASRGPGHGLIGMRERVRICGGRLSTGPLSEGGFEVRLSLPTNSAPLEDASACP